MTAGLEIFREAAGIIQYASQTAALGWSWTKPNKEWSDALKAIRDCGETLTLYGQTLQIGRVIQNPANKIPTYTILVELEAQSFQLWELCVRVEDFQEFWVEMDKDSKDPKSGISNKSFIPIGSMRLR